MGLKLEGVLDIPILAGKVSPIKSFGCLGQFPGLTHNFHKMAATFGKPGEIKEVQ